MWSSVMVLVLPIALNPVRLGLTLLLISRPRPVQNLLAYWVGNLVACIPTVVVPLTLLHVTPMFKTLAQDLATSSTARHIQIGMGVLALSIAALMIVRPLAAPAEIGSVIRRLSGRAHNAWENGSLWVALVIGIGNMPAPDMVLFALAIIGTSGAAMSTQVSAAIALVVGMFAVVEITLVSYLAIPAKTQAVLRLLHDWARAHRRNILLAVFAVAGVSLVFQGT